MLLDELPRSRHVGGLVFFAPDDQLIRQNGKVLRKNIQEPQHRAIPVAAIKRTIENKPAQVASNPPCNPTRGVAG